MPTRRTSCFVVAADDQPPCLALGYVPLALVLLTGGLLSACAGSRGPLTGVSGSGASAGEDRAVSGFTGVAVASGLRAEISIADSFSVHLTGDDNILPLIETVVEANVLKIRPLDDQVLRPSRPIVAVVTLPALDTLAASGGSHVEASGASGAKVHMTSSGGSQMNASAVDAQSVAVESSGGSQLSLTGQADGLDATLSGGSRLTATKLTARAVTLSASGGSHAEVAASDTLHATISGGTQACYTGDPTVTSDTSGGANLSPCP